MTTGCDDNDDGVFNDRPEGVTRNSLRGDSTWGLNLNLSRRFALGAASRSVAPAAAGRLRRPRRPWRPRRPGGSRYSMELFAQAQNVLNHVTHTGYTGNLSSPFFGRRRASARRAISTWG